MADAILISQNQRIVFANPATLRLFEAADPLIGQPIADQFHADGRPALEQLMKRVAGGESAGPVEQRALRCDGSVRDVEISATSIPFQDAPAILLVVRDVSEEKQRIAALRESEERLTLAFAGAQEGVWDWNVETGTVIYSPRWKQMLGYGDDEIEPHVRAWASLLHPDDKPRADALNQAVMRDRGPYEGEFRLRHKDGHYISVLTRGLPVRREPGGPIVRIVGTHLDITERNRTESALRESEERLTLAFAGAQEGVWDWNLETNDVVYSSRWKQMLGYADEEIESHISAWERLVHPEDRTAAVRANESVARGHST